MKNNSAKISISTAICLLIVIVLLGLLIFVLTQNNNNGENNIENNTTVLEGQNDITSNNINGLTVSDEEIIDEMNTQGNILGTNE